MPGAGRHRHRRGRGYGSEPANHLSRIPSGVRSGLSRKTRGPSHRHRPRTHKPRDYLADHRGRTTVGVYAHARGGPMPRFSFRLADCIGFPRTPRCPLNLHLFCSSEQRNRPGDAINTSAHAEPNAPFLNLSLVKDPRTTPAGYRLVISATAAGDGCAIEMRAVLLITFQHFAVWYGLH